LQEGKYELIIEYKDQKIIYNVDVSGKKRNWRRYTWYI
jgi:hypothetical protein